MKCEFHYCAPPDTVTMNYGLGKVIGENETGFRGAADVLYRTEAWDFLLAGGGLYNNLDYSFTSSHPDGSLAGYKSPGGGSRELRQQLRILKEFLYAFDFVRMKPDASVVTSTAPAELTTYALTETGRAYAIGLHVPLPAKPKNLPSLLNDNIEAKLSLALPEGKYRAEWINTRNGLVDGARTMLHTGGEVTLESPAFANDIALRVHALPESADVPPVFDDAFDAELKPGWKWVRENDDEWRLRSGGLEMRVQKGRVWAGNDARNVLVLERPEDPGKVRAEVSARLCLPKTIYEQGGLLRYAGDDAFVKLVIEHIGGKYYIVMAREVGEKRRVFTKKQIPAPVARLAMEIEGDNIRCHYWDTRSGAWNDAGSCELEGAASAKFALFTQDGSGTEIRWARFDDFQIVTPE